MPKKPLKIEIEFKKLEQIARYYEFPVAVFLMDKIPRGTRNNALLKHYKKVKDKIKKIVDEL